MQSNPTRRRGARPEVYNSAIMVQCVALSSENSITVDAIYCVCFYASLHISLVITQCDLFRCWIVKVRLMKHVVGVTNEHSTRQGRHMVCDKRAVWGTRTQQQGSLRMVVTKRTLWVRRHDSADRASKLVGRFEYKTDAAGTICTRTFHEP
jgi:hypothetical protein